MRNYARINHFPPTLFSPNRSPIYGEAHLFSQPASRLVTGNPSLHGEGVSLTRAVDKPSECRACQPRRLVPKNGAGAELLGVHGLALRERVRALMEGSVRQSCNTGWQECHSELVRLCVHRIAMLQYARKLRRFLWMNCHAKRLAARGLPARFASRNGQRPSTIQRRSRSHVQSGLEARAPAVPVPVLTIDTLGAG
jgi:hypothetical protein